MSAVRVIKKTGGLEPPQPPPLEVQSAQSEVERAEAPTRRRGSGKMKEERAIDFFRPFFGKELVLQMKKGTVITGLLTDYKQGFLMLENVSIRGLKNKAFPPVLMLDRQTIGWFHEPCEIEKIES